MGPCGSPAFAEAAWFVPRAPFEVACAAAAATTVYSVDGEHAGRSPAAAGRSAGSVAAVAAVVARFAAADPVTDC